VHERAERLRDLAQLRMVGRDLDRRPVLEAE
jgi:hypothetical protein